MRLSGGAAGRSRARVSSSGAKRARRQRRALAISLFASYRPHARQLALHRDRAPRIVVNAGRRSGKTHGLGHAFMGRVSEDYGRARREVSEGRRPGWARPKKLMRETTPFLKYWVVAPTYDLVAGCARVIFDILGGTSGPLVLKYDQTTRQLWLRGGILIEFKSGERPERLVGVGLDGAWLDEAARLKPTVWYDSVEPTLAEFGGWAYLSSTPLGQNFFFDLFQRTQLTTEPKKKLSGWSGHHFRTIDNTAMPLLVAAAKAAKLALPEAYYRRNYEADFYSFEGKIYELFIDSTPHVVDELPGSYVRLVAGLDWGWKNPGVITVVGFTSEDAAYVVGEEYASGVHVAPPPGAHDDPDFDSWCARAIRWARQGVDGGIGQACNPLQGDGGEERGHARGGPGGRDVRLDARARRPPRAEPLHPPGVREHAA